MFRALLFTLSACCRRCRPAARRRCERAVRRRRASVRGRRLREAVRLFTAAREAGSRDRAATTTSACPNTGSAITPPPKRPSQRWPASFRRCASWPSTTAVSHCAPPATSPLHAAFGRARSSTDEKIVALANAQLGELGAPRVPPSRVGAVPSGRARLRRQRRAGGRAALAEQRIVEPARGSARRVERDFGARRGASIERLWVRYSDVGEFDQSALRMSLVTEQRARGMDARRRPDARAQHARWRRIRGAHRRRLAAASRLRQRTVVRGARHLRRCRCRRCAVRVSRRLAAATATRDAARGHGARSRRLRLRAQRPRRSRSVGVAAAVVGCVSMAVTAAWSADAALVHRKSRYSEASVPRDERLLELSFAAHRELSIGWTLGDGLPMVRQRLERRRRSRTTGSAWRSA